VSAVTHPPTSDAVRVECRRLRVDEAGLTFREIGERVGVSESTAWKFARDIAFVNRRCSCGEAFTVKRESRRVLCDRCRENAQARAREAQARLVEQARALICDDCGTELLTPAALCGMCDPDFDLEAALAALDNEERPAVTGRSTTHGGKP
jgi:hypothetical protein